MAKNETWQQKVEGRGKEPGKENRKGIRRRGQGKEKGAVEQATGNGKRIGREKTMRRMKRERKGRGRGKANGTMKRIGCPIFLSLILILLLLFVMFSKASVEAIECSWIRAGNYIYTHISSKRGRVQQTLLTLFYLL